MASSQQQDKLFVPKRRTFVVIGSNPPDELWWLKEELEERHCLCRETSSGKQVLEWASELKPDIILLGLLLKDMRGVECCAHLKADPGLKHIPLLFLTTVQDVVAQINHRKSGADDYIVTVGTELELIIKRILLYMRAEWPAPLPETPAPLSMN